MNTYNIDDTALVYVLITLVIVTLLISYAVSYVMTDSGRLELKKLVARKQLDLELAKVGAVELIKVDEARDLMLKAMQRAPGATHESYPDTINALISDRP